MKILVINSGSSSIKYQLFDMARRLALAAGIVERIGEEGSRIKHNALAPAAANGDPGCRHHRSPPGPVPDGRPTAG